MSVSSFMGWDRDKKAQAAQDQYQQAIDQARTDYEAGVRGAMTPYQQMVAQNDPVQRQQQYIDVLDLDATKYGVGGGQLEYNNPLDAVSSFLDPSLDFQMQQASNQVQESAAGSGGLFSGAAGMEIANRTRQMAETGWAEAFERARSEEARKQGLTTQQLQNDLSRQGFNVGLEDKNINRQGVAYDTARNPLDQLTGTELDLQGTNLGVTTGQAGTAYQGRMNDLNRPTGFEQLTGAVKQGAETAGTLAKIFRGV